MENCNYSQVWFGKLMDPYVWDVDGKEDTGGWDEGFSSLVVLCIHGDQDEEFQSHC